MNRQRRQRKSYMARRIVALILLAFMIFLIYFIINKLFGNVKDIGKNSKSANAHTETVEESKIAPFLTDNLVLSVTKQAQKTIADSSALKELLPYRQEKMKLHSMGKGAAQSLLNKEVYLTFDDGPSSKVTEQILDILKEEGIKATFFVIGKNVEIYPEILKRIHAEGHDIGIHTYSHNYKEIYASPEALQKDIEKCLASIRKVLGEDFKTNLYRFPGGSYRKNKEIYIKKIEEMGYVYFDWNALNGDAEGVNLTDKYLLDRFKQTSRGYNVILSLMHDTDAKQNTVRTLPTIIKDLKDKNYEFKKLGDV